MMSDIRRRATPVGANTTYYKMFVFIKREEEGYNDAIINEYINSSFHKHFQKNQHATIKG